MRNKQKQFAAALLAAAIAAAIVAALGASQTAPASGDLIAFARKTGTGTSDIYVVRPDGTALRRLTIDTASFDPAWSPDRRRIAFARELPGAAGAPEIFVMDANGRNVRQVTRIARTDLAWSANEQPTWTPDGERIVFVRTDVREGTSTTDLWSVRPDGGAPRRMTNAPGAERAPAYSEFGFLAFERDGAIYVKHPRESAARRIARGTDPAWSQGGYFVAFSRGGVVYRVGADGKGIRRVTRGSSPSWSGDGGRIVVATERGLVTVLRNGRDVRRVTRTPSLVHDVSPSWSTARRP